MRKTQQGDVPRILEFLNDYFRASNAKLKLKVELDLERCKKFLELAVVHESCISYFSDDGVVLGELTETWFGANKIARGVIWYVRPEARNGILARRLLKAFDDEAKARGAVYVFNDLHNAANIAMIDPLMKRFGYDDYSKSYLKEL